MTIQPADSGRSSTYWALQGMKGIISPPAFILITAILGFAGLARDADLSWLETSFMTFMIGALPAQIILVGAATAGISLPAAAFAVALSSIRMMPMTVVLMAQMRGPGTRTRTLILLSHFVAVTNWIFAMERLDRVPRDRRPIFFGGFAVTLAAINTVNVALVFNLMGQLPALATGALAFLTPVYFLTSLFGSARESAGRFALLTGMIFLPPAHWLLPEIDLLVAGIAGGAAAYFAGRAVDGRRIG